MTTLAEAKLALRRVVDSAEGLFWQNRWTRGEVATLLADLALVAGYLASLGERGDVDWDTWY